MLRSQRSTSVTFGDNRVHPAQHAEKTTSQVQMPDEAHVSAPPPFVLLQPSTLLYLASILGLAAGWGRP